MGMYYVSDRSQEVLGISSNAAEFFGRFTGQVDPRDREAFLNSVNEAVRLQSPWNFEGRFVKPSGGNIWFHGISRPFVRGTEIVFSGVLLDITERRRDEEQSRESRERFRRIFEDSPLGIAIVSADFRFRMVNRQFCEMLMYSEVELLDKSFPEITHPDYIVPDIAEVRKIYSGEREMYRTEKRYVKKDGSFLWASLTASAVKDDTGTVLYTIALIEDITERKQAEETIVRVNKKLNILNDLTRRDLTSQIFILKSYLELVIESAAGQDQILRQLQKIEQIIRSINDITEFTRDYQNMGESPPKWQNVSWRCCSGSPMYLLPEFATALRRKTSKFLPIHCSKRRSRASLRTPSRTGALSALFRSGTGRHRTGLPSSMKTMGPASRRR